MLTDINLLQDIINIRSFFTLSSVSWDTHNPNSLILISRVNTLNFTQNNLDNFANLQFLHSLIGNTQNSLDSNRLFIFYRRHAIKKKGIQIKLLFSIEQYLILISTSHEFQALVNKTKLWNTSYCKCCLRCSLSKINE